MVDDRAYRLDQVEFDAVRALNDALKGDITTVSVIEDGPMRIQMCMASMCAGACRRHGLREDGLFPGRRQRNFRYEYMTR